MMSPSTSALDDFTYRWVERKSLPTDKISCLWKVAISELDDWVPQERAGSDTGDNQTGVRQ